jgi:hypothetical protein
MSDKLYVRELIETSVDGDKLQVVKVYESKVSDATYIVFIEK